MKLKTLLLGSAFAVVRGAQAADLSVAEPVDDGVYTFASATGTSGHRHRLKIGGYVRFEATSIRRHWLLGNESPTPFGGLGFCDGVTSHRQVDDRYGPLTGIEIAGL